MVYSAMPPKITEEQIQAYIRSVENARAEFEGIRTDPIEAATDPHRYASGLPDEAAIRSQVAVANYEWERILSQLSPEMQERAKKYILELQYAGFRGNKPLEYDPNALDRGDQPYRAGAGGFLPAPTHRLGISPAYFNPYPTSSPHYDPTDPERPMWGGWQSEGDEFGIGSMRGVFEHEMGAHLIDDLMAPDDGYDWPDVNGKLGKRKIWHEHTPEGRKFMSSQGTGGWYTDTDRKSPTYRKRVRVDNNERFAGFMTHVFATGIVPTEYGDMIFNRLKKHIPGLRQEYLGLDEPPDPNESPYEAYMRIRMENEGEMREGDIMGASGSALTDAERKVELARAKFLHSVDDRDQGRNRGGVIGKWNPLPDKRSHVQNSQLYGPRDELMVGDPVGEDPQEMDVNDLDRWGYTNQEEFLSDEPVSIGSFSRSVRHGPLQKEEAPAASAIRVEDIERQMKQWGTNQEEFLTEEAALGDDPRRHASPDWPYSARTFPESVTVKEYQEGVPGGTISGISEFFGITEEELIRANQIPDPNTIDMGSTLKIPMPDEEEVPAQRMDKQQLIDDVMYEVAMQMALKKQYEEEARGQWAQRFGTPEMEAMMMDPDFEDFVARASG